jgi:hypothetical protein
MCQPRKIGGQQLSYNNNFTRATSATIFNTQPESKGIFFREWTPLALDEKVWLNFINAYFDECRTIDKDCDDE